MSKPQIIIPDHKGFHNNNPDTRGRLEKAGSYKDLSTIMITPCLDTIPSRVVQNWLNLMKPMNQKFIHIMPMNMEVGHAYSSTVEQILSRPDLSSFKYIFTLEHDNMVDPDVLLKLYPDMNEYDAVGSLYWTKGDQGQPMCYGNPNQIPVNFIPFMPAPNSVTQCRGLGMGATLFKLDMFKDDRFVKPIFETVQSYTPGVGVKAYTQDLKFFENAGSFGYKFACSTKTLTGHFDVANDKVW